MSSRRASGRLARVGALLALTAFLPACEQAPPEAETIVRPVKIHTIGGREHATIREYPGTIRAYQNAQMGFEVPGRITEFLFQESDVVAENDVLARLDPRDFEAQLKAAEADVRKAEADLARSEGVFNKDPGAISKETIDSDRRAVEVALARLDVSKKALEDTELRAPFGGLMARKLVPDFANVQAKEPVLILQDISVLEIEVAVPERDLAKRSTAETKETIEARVQPVVVVSALPDRSFPARIKEIATTADPETRTFSAKLTFDNPGDVNILPGMTARVRIIDDTEFAWTIPASATQADENGNPYVWHVTPDGMTVRRVPVELGEVRGDRVQITGGLAEGDLVAISGVTFLSDGMQVRAYER